MLVNIYQLDIFKFNCIKSYKAKFSFIYVNILQFNFIQLYVARSNIVTLNIVKFNFAQYNLICYCCILFNMIL